MDVHAKNVYKIYSIWFKWFCKRGKGYTQIIWGGGSGQNFVWQQSPDKITVKLQD